MQSIYWICFVGGGIFVFLAAIGGIDGAEIDIGDLDIAADIGLYEPTLEVGEGIDQDLELIDQDAPDKKESAKSFNPLVLLATLKFWTFGSCFFGLTGLLITFFQPERNVVSTFSISLLTGLFIGGMVSWVFHALRTRIPTGMASPDELVGLLATIEIPVSPNVRGKIRVQFRDGSREISARTNDALELSVGDSVMIVGMEGNLAWVVAESSLREESS